MRPSASAEVPMPLMLHSGRGPERVVQCLLIRPSPLQGRDVRLDVRVQAETPPALRRVLAAVQTRGKMADSAALGGVLGRAS